MPMKTDREYRTMAPMAARAADEGAEKAYIVEGYATTFDDPYLLYDDISETVDKGAFDGCDFSDVIMQFDHMGMVFARTRNKSLRLDVDDHGLKVTADLGLTEQSRQLYEAISTGLVDRMSFAFTIAEDAFDHKTRTSHIVKIGKLYDVSAVSIPANPGTDISAKRKELLDGEIRQMRQERAAAEAKRKEQSLKARKLLLKVKLLEVMNDD